MLQRWYNVGRIGAISDGVFAIAMTLLVLDLKLPELKEPISSEIYSKALLGRPPILFPGSLVLRFFVASGSRSTGFWSRMRNNL